ncbi:MAG TPA: hypothetical protein VM096_03405, partial [Vicinamibacterales bacterium]|nr:hypothetical protein [Vicinamibacterales bacterium]
SGRLMSANGAHIIAVQYSLDGNGDRGRLRPIDPQAHFPPWLVANTQAKLSAHDGAVVDVAITLVKLPREGWKDDDHFVEFVVRQIRH